MDQSQAGVDRYTEGARQEVQGLECWQAGHRRGDHCLPGAQELPVSATATKEAAGLCWQAQHLSKTERSQKLQHQPVSAASGSVSQAVPSWYGA